MTPDRNPWLESLIRPHSRPYSERAPLALESVGRLLARLGNPQARLRAVHIAGSKGKGSTALMIEALARAAGLRTGTFTSPHLERWTERFRIGGREISRAELDLVIEALRPHVEALARAHPENPPSFFDVLTAMAFWLFERRGVEIAIIETGIGGRYDATNIVRPEVACITNVEHEHSDKLGTDLAAIAAHKAGILKPGASAVLGSFEEAAEKVIQARAEETGCESAWLNKEFEIHREDESGDEQLVYISGNFRIEFPLAHPGRHMAENAALALACVQRLKGIESARLKSVAAVLAGTALPGRIEILRREPWWVVDAAHTQRSIAALADAINALPAVERHFVISLSADKPVSMLSPLLETATSVIVTSPEPLRSAPAPGLASEISARYPEKDVEIEPDVALALTRARSRMGSASLLCAAGSTYIAGAARRFLLPFIDAGGAAPLPDRRSIAVGTRAIDGASSPAQSSAQLLSAEKAGDEARGG